MNKKTVATIVTIIIIFTTIFNNSINANAAANGSWKQTDGCWWYEYADGSYAHNEYIDGYWLDASGWYDSAWNGSWKSDSKGWWFQSGNWYPSNKWLKIDGQWYYFKSNGYMACNEWIGNYYLTNSGTLATNTWIGDYYVGSDGAWVPGKAKSSTSMQTTNIDKNNAQSNTTNNNQITNQTNNQTTNQASNTPAHTHNWQVTFFYPTFTSKFEYYPIAGRTNGIDDYSLGWYNYNTIVCNCCNTEYSTYAEYRATDTCAILTCGEDLYNNYYKNQVGIEYVQEIYVKDNDNKLYKSGNEWAENSNYSNCGIRIGGPNYSYNPEIIYHYSEVISTHCNCGITK